jgi:hypothetical protein
MQFQAKLGFLGNEQRLPHFCKVCNSRNLLGRMEFIKQSGGERPQAHQARNPGWAYNQYLRRPPSPGPKKFGVFPSPIDQHFRNSQNGVFNFFPGKKPVSP